MYLTIADTTCVDTRENNEREFRHTSTGPRGETIIKHLRLVSDKMQLYIAARDVSDSPSIAELKVAADDLANAFGELSEVASVSSDSNRYTYRLHQGVSVFEAGDTRKGEWDNCYVGDTPLGYRYREYPQDNGPWSTDLVAV